jgi:hypothetical protein
MSEVRRFERRHKEALVGILQLIEEMMPELKPDQGKANYLREKLQKLQFLMR